MRKRMRHGTENEITSECARRWLARNASICSPEMCQPNVSGSRSAEGGEKIREKESRLQNGKTGNDGAIWEMSGLLYGFAVVEIFSHAYFGLEDFHQLFYAILLSAQLLKGLQNLAQFRRCLVVREAVNVFPNILFHGLSLQLSTIQSLAISAEWFIARSW